MGVIELQLSAVRDGVTWIVTITQPANGRKQVIAGVVADSAEGAIERVFAILERNAKRDLGEAVCFTRSSLVSERSGDDGTDDE